MWLTVKAMGWFCLILIKNDILFDCAQCCHFISKCERVLSSIFIIKVPPQHYSEGKKIFDSWKTLKPFLSLIGRYAQLIVLDFGSPFCTERIL